MISFTQGRLILITLSLDALEIRVWSMAGKTIRFTLELSSVDDWLFTELEPEEEAEEKDDCCISIVVFELITFFLGY